MHDILDLQEEVAEQCLADTKELLNKEDGSRFDQAFIGLQIAQHAAMKSKLTVFQRHVSGELQEQIKSSLERVKSHQQKAEQLMKDLEKEDAR